MWYWLMVYRRRWGLVAAALAGAGIALGRMDPWTRERVVWSLLACLLGSWPTVLPWTLVVVLFLLWRGAALRLRATRQTADYWIDQAAERATPRRAPARPRSKVGAGRRG